MATVAQLGAARRLSQRGVLVRASHTVEALGRVATICYDNTGMLTEGRLRLVRAAGLDDEWAPDVPEARRLLREAAHAGPSPSGRGPLPHATDQAALAPARAVLGEELQQSWEELVEIAFHSDRGFSAFLGRKPGKVPLVVKGAPTCPGSRPLNEALSGDAARAANRGPVSIGPVRTRLPDLPWEALCRAPDGRSASLNATGIERHHPQLMSRGPGPWPSAEYVPQAPTYRPLASQPLFVRLHYSTVINTADQPNVDTSHINLNRPTLWH